MNNASFPQSFDKNVQGARSDGFIYNNKYFKKLLGAPKDKLKEFKIVVSYNFLCMNIKHYIKVTFVDS